MAKYRKLSVGDVERSADPEIWAINSTQGNLRGEVNFDIPKANGSGSDAIIVPVTFVAVCLTEQASREQIMRASSFRNTVRKGLISIISAKDAQEINSMPGAKIEIARIQKQSMQATADLQGEAHGVVDVEVPDNIEVTKKSKVRTEDAVRPIIKNLVQELKTQNEIEVVNTLRNLNLKKPISQSEYAYVRDKATKLKKSKVASFCSSKIKK